MQFTTAQVDHSFRAYRRGSTPRNHARFRRSWVPHPSILRVRHFRSTADLYLPLPLTPPTAPASDSSPQTASDANTDIRASDRSPYPAWRSARPSTSTPPPANSAEAAPRSARQSPRCPPSAAVAANSGPPPAPACLPRAKPPPAHPPPCTNTRPQPAAQNPPSCAAGSAPAAASRARSFPSIVPNPADSTQSFQFSDRSPAASTPIQTPAQSASNTPDGQRTESTHIGRPPPATSSNASPKNSNTRC